MTQLVTASAASAHSASTAARNARRSQPRRIAPARRRRGSQPIIRVPSRQELAYGLELLASYTDALGRGREVIAAKRGDGCVLVIDRDRLTLGDRRLLAHLAPDEPPSNAALVCALYLDDARRVACRRVCPEDLVGVHGLAEVENEPPPIAGPYAPEPIACSEDGEDTETFYTLEPQEAGRVKAELRWRACPHRAGRPCAEPRPVSLRQVVGALESYEPVCERSLAALNHYERDPKVSAIALRGELERLRESPVVLNRALREAVLRAIERGTSMGEIASRCNRLKRDGQGNVSGQTSWLARRIGVMPESGSARPTPWIHSEVLAQIAREGLGISPREVEL